MKCKKLFKYIVVMLCLMLIVGNYSVSAYNSYTTYIYTRSGRFAGVECPDAYVPERIIDSGTIGLHYLRGVPLDSPQDLCVDAEMNLYIVDQKNDRIVVLNPDYSFKFIVNTFVNAWGVPDGLSQPKGVFVDEKNIYVADTQKNRLVVFDKEGQFERIVPQPESDVFPENHVYTPVAVAVDGAGRIYVVSSTTFQGIIAMGPDGDFQGFVGAQKASYNPFQIFWRNFQTKEQRQATIKNVSTEYNNIAIDGDGFVFATTSSIDESRQLAQIDDKNSDYSPVKRLNPQGTDIMRRTDRWAPAGEALVGMGGFGKGVSRIIDVAIGPEGTWSIIDEKRQKVYTYDEDGKFLFAYGDEGTQFGNLRSIQAIAYQDTKILLLDKADNNITIYKRTIYGDTLLSAIELNHERRYDEAVEAWKDILKRNNNFDIAYTGIGKSYHREGYYLDAMEEFKYSVDTESYSKSFGEYRKLWIENYVVVIPLVLFAFIFGIGMFMKNANKVNKRDQIRGDRKLKLSSHMLYGFYIIFHPFDGFWDMKHEQRGSLLAAIIYMVLACLSAMYQALGRAYILNPNGGYNDFFAVSLGIIIPVSLWTIANWCLTTLFDGEGSVKDIFMVTCYSLIPFIVITTLTTLASNVVIQEEVALLTMVSTFAYIWLGLLIFFGVMVIHDYTLGKNIVTALGTIIGMAFIMFVALLFSSLLIKMVGFVNGIYIEVAYRL